MKVGDKVRMLKDTIQGVVVRVIDERQVEIEDDFGFGMPVLISDLVLVSPMEDKYFKDKPSTDKASKEFNSSTSPIAPKVSKGFYLAVVEEHKNYALYISNNTNSKHFVNVFSKKREEYKNLFFNVLSSKSAVRIGLYPLSEIDSWNSVFVGFQAKSSSFSEFSSVSKKINLSKLKKSPQDIPLLDSKGLCIQLDSDLEIDRASLETSINNSKTTNASSNLLKPKEEVDLHAEALGIDENLENYEILLAQIAAFQKSIESAIANNMTSITFIHGVGNGKLRMEIHKRMKDYSEVKYFEDANQTRFGYGATKVMF